MHTLRDIWKEDMNDIVLDPKTGEELTAIDVQLYALNLADDGRVLRV